MQAHKDCFKLPSRANIFRVTRCFTMLGGTLPCVEGVTLDGRFKTTARVVDVEFCNAPISRATAKRRLAARHAEQCDRFPTMREDIPLALFIRRNIVAVMAGGLLASYDAKVAA